MDRAGASVKSCHVLQNLLFEEKPIIFENRNIFVNLWGIAGKKLCPAKLKQI
jgi:hypothetical protein